MENAPMQHCVHPGRQTSHFPLLRVTSAKAESTIWISF
jgi:hypothetical protein